MKILIFIVLVTACAIALIWATRKTVDEQERARHRQDRRRRQRQASDKLAAPGDSLLSRKEELWATRRQHANLGVEDLNRFKPRSDTHGVPEYDGYSRRDRHHVLQPEARVRDQTIAEDEVTITALGIEPDTEKPKKNRASGSDS